MIHFYKLTLLAIVVAAGVGTVGCKKKPKHPTPIPGYTRYDSTNYNSTAGGPSDFNSTGIKRNTTTAGSGSSLNPDNGSKFRDVPSNSGTDPNASPFGSDPNNRTGNGAQGLTGGQNVPLGDLSNMENWGQDRGMFVGNTLFFKYDSASIGKAEIAKAAAVAEYLKSNPAQGVLVEGHCDERGTEGYNLALGERRALAAREVLVNMGVKAEHIRTISYGEEKPAVNGHDESAYSKNRRAEFILLSPGTAR